MTYESGKNITNVKIKLYDHTDNNRFKICFFKIIFSSNIKFNHNITDEFVSEFNELIIKVECIKYVTLVITEISKGDNLENRNKKKADSSSYSTSNTRQSKHTDTITTTNLPTHQTHQT